MTTSPSSPAADLGSEPTAAASVAIEPTGVSLSLPGEAPMYFNAYWLRDNCPTSFDLTTREREFDILSAPDDLTPDAAEIEGDALRLRWPDGHETQLGLEWLAAHGRPGGAADPAQVQRRLWYSDHYSSIPRFSHAELKASRSRVGDWAEALLVEGVALITDMPAASEESGDVLLETAALMGAPRPTFFGMTFEVRTHINPINLAYTPKALPMHTDVPAEESAPGVQFLHCLANDAEGGDSLFADGAAVAEDLRREDPDAFEVLAREKALYRFEHDGFDVRAHQTAIELDPDGAVSGVTFSQHMWAVSDLPQRVLDRYYPAYRKFASMVRQPKYLMRFRLNAGECIVFDNHRILHGRTAYSASGGSRHLRGTYVDRGEVRSMYRVHMGGRG